MTTFMGAILTHPLSFVGLPTAWLPSQMSQWEQTALEEHERVIEGHGFHRTAAGKIDNFEKLISIASQRESQSPQDYAKAVSQSRFDFALLDRLAGSRTTHFLRMGNLFEEWGISPTPLNEQLYLLGLSASKMQIAVDLDGTLADSYVNHITGGTIFQMKPGAQAWIAGLAQQNSVLLYTARDTAQLTKFFSSQPVFQRVFLRRDPVKEVRPEEIFDSPHIFSRADWVEAMILNLEHGLEKPGELMPLEERILNLWEIFKDFPLSMLHVKLDAFPLMLGKQGFDVLIDDSEGLPEILGLLGSALKYIQLPARPPLKTAEDFPECLQDILLRTALILYSYRRGNKNVQLPQRIDEAKKITEAEADIFEIGRSEGVYRSERLEYLEQLRRRWLDYKEHP